MILFKKCEDTSFKITLKDKDGNIVNIKDCVEDVDEDFIKNIKLKKKKPIINKVTSSGNHYPDGVA